jgi:hypothetical protein
VGAKLRTFLTSISVGGECSASRSGLFIPGKEHSVAIASKAGWHLELVWTLWRRDPCHCWELNPGHLARSQSLYCSSYPGITIKVNYYNLFIYFSFTPICLIFWNYKIWLKNIRIINLRRVSYIFSSLMVSNSGTQTSNTENVSHNIVQFAHFENGIAWFFASCIIKQSQRMRLQENRWRKGQKGEGGESLPVFISVLIQFGYHAPFENQSAI